MLAQMKLRPRCPQKGRQAPTRADGLLIPGSAADALTGHERAILGGSDQQPPPQWVPFGVQARSGAAAARHFDVFFRLKNRFHFRNPITGADLPRPATRANTTPQLTLNSLQKKETRHAQD